MRFVFFLQVALLSFSSNTYAAALNTESPLVKLAERTTNVLEFGCNIEDSIPNEVKLAGNLGYVALSAYGPVKNKFFKMGTCYPYVEIKSYFFNRMVAWNKVPIFNQKNMDSLSKILGRSGAKTPIDEKQKEKLLLKYDAMVKDGTITVTTNNPTNNDKIEAVLKKNRDFMSKSIFQFLFFTGVLRCWMVLDMQVQTHASPSFKNIYNHCMFCINILSNRVIFIPFYVYRHQVGVKKFLADLKLISSNQMA